MSLLQRLRDRRTQRRKRRTAADLDQARRSRAAGVVSPVDRQGSQTWGA